MSELLTGGAQPSSQGPEVAVVYAGDYVNKLSGRLIERECLQSIERGCRALVINFRDTELVNSIGVSILLGVIDIAERSGARVVFSNVGSHTFKLFELLGLTRLVVLAESEEAALATLCEFTPAAPAGGH
jgi:anti-anti-sigma factor